MAETWNFGTPRRGAVYSPIRDVRVVRNGKTWTASYHTEGDRLLVSSAWGSRTVPVGRTRDLEKRATALLADILNERP